MSDGWLDRKTADAFDLACEAADIRTFRQEPTLSMVFSGFNDQHAESLLQRAIGIAEHYKDLDAVGNPKRLPSPEFARYRLIVNHLRELFGSLDGMNIIEIGGGFGGLAACLCRSFKLSDYLILDRKSATCLQERYLKACKIDGVRLMDWTKLNYLPAPDLVISTWALDELPPILQAGYAATVMRSDMGYIQISSYYKDQAHWLESAIGPHGHIKTFENNQPERWFHRVLTWGHEGTPSDSEELK